FAFRGNARRKVSVDSATRKRLYLELSRPLHAISRQQTIDASCQPFESYSIVVFPHYLKLGNIRLKPI
ncbi:MAG: hypothetical protein ACKPKO_44145, partial [Candidatus Fonsibacter sp.]